MPFKLNQHRRRHIPKQKHKVTNSAAYDAALRQRGSLTVWFTDEAVAAWKAEPRTTPWRRVVREGQGRKAWQFRLDCDTPLLLTRAGPLGTVTAPRTSARPSPKRPLLRPLILALVLAAGWAGTAEAQSTTCRNGTVLTGTAGRAGCAGHGGLPNPFNSDAPLRTEAAPHTEASLRRTATNTSRTSQTPGGGPGMVWVNTGTKTYHCPGTRYYGLTKRGEYMTEAAKAARAHHGGKACS